MAICVSSAPEVMWSIMASFMLFVEFGPGSYVVNNYGFINFMLFVVDKYAWDFYTENANF